MATSTDVFVGGMQIFSVGVMESCFHGALVLFSNFLSVLSLSVVGRFEPGLVCKFCSGAYFGISCRWIVEIVSISERKGVCCTNFVVSDLHEFFLGSLVVDFQTAIFSCLD